MNITRLKIQKIAWITLAWTIISLFIFFIGYGTLDEYGFSNQVDIFIPLKASFITGISAGILGGTLIVFAWEKWLRTKAYGLAIRNSLISYTLLFVFIAFLSTLFFQTQLLQLPPYHQNVIANTVHRTFSLNTLVPFFTWLSVCTLTIIALLVNDKYGHGVFRKFLMGHYFNPKREERIFMFLDLRSSTVIAENLGEERYFSFLKEAFKTATPAILKNQGEIYQYVGDEIIISWELEKGKKDAQCIQCYFDVRTAMSNKHIYFEENYGYVPEFKAGIHYGQVMAGEIGMVKREIAFSGDVLNTTSRIQSKCNDLNVNILASKAIIDLLENVNLFSTTEIGAIELRGKKQKVTLFTL